MTCDLPGILECINETATGRTVNGDFSIQVIKSVHIKVYTAGRVYITYLLTYSMEQSPS